jgi:hypothetical protein
MGGLRGVVLIQTSGFALIANALASLIVPYQIPAIVVVSEGGTLGEFNVGQVMVSRTMRPTLDALAMAHHTLTDQATMPFIVDKSIKQAFTTQSPVVFIRDFGEPLGARRKALRDADRAPVRRGRPGAARGQDRRQARHRADRARSAAHPSSLHARSQHRAHGRAG